MAVLTKFHLLFFLKQNGTCFCLVAGSLSCQDLDTYELRKKCQHVAYKNATIFLPMPKYTFYCRLSNPDSVALFGKDSWACCCHVDILVHNAGVPSRSTFLEAIPEINAKLMPAATEWKQPTTVRIGNAPVALSIDGKSEAIEQNTTIVRPITFGNTIQFVNNGKQ